MRLTMTLVLGMAIAASSAACGKESVQLGRGGVSKEEGKGEDVCPGGGQICAAESVAPAVCGDGIVQPGAGEICDDGGTLDGDGCSSTCRSERFSRVVELALGFASTCALNEDGRVKCWGANMFGVLGLGDLVDRGGAPNQMGDALPSVDLGDGKRAVAIASGNGFMCALLNDHRVKCWGGNESGELGLGDVLDRGDAPNEMGDNLPAIDLGTGRTAVALAAGEMHTCAVLDDGHVKCWGYNTQGELGLGDTLNRGDAPNEMGDNLPAVDLGQGKKAVAIAVGSSHTCALLDDGHVKCWGMNAFSALGLGDNLSRGDAPNEMGDSLPAVDLGQGKKAVAIAAGSNHTCALLQDGHVKCWGFNSFGALGLGDKSPRGYEPADMGDNLPAVDLGQGKSAVAITAFSDGACALLDDGRIKCWGDNYRGVLGLGDQFVRGDGPNEMGDKLPPVDLGQGKIGVAICSGYFHNCALLEDGSVKCWGSADSGGLGLGDLLNRGDDPNEMGDNLPAVDL
jgi:cysteine-rich repeat protein